MCSPMIGTVISAVGIGLQASAAAREVSAQNQAAEYNAKVSETNAAIAKQNAALEEARAKDAVARGELEEKQFRLKLSQTKGAQRSAFAAAGVAVDSGSSLDTLLDTTTFGEIDALTIRNNAAREAWGNRITAANYQSQASQLNAEAKMLRSTKRSAVLPVATTLLSGGNALAQQMGLYGGR